MKLSISVALGAVLLLPFEAQAQSAQLVSVQASGLLISLNGSSFSGLGFGTGMGGEFQLRLNPSLWSIGAGVQITKHSANSGFKDDLTLTGFFIEPRYAFPIGGKAHPYLAGRLAYLSQGITLQQGSQGIPVTATGTAIGAGGGFVIVMSSNVNFDVGVAVTTAQFGDYTVSGQTGYGAAGSGSSFVLKAGLNIGLGKN